MFAEVMGKVMINNAQASPGSSVTIGEVKASSTVLQAQTSEFSLNDMRTIMKTIGEDVVCNIVLSKMSPGERKELSAANTTATDVKKLITGGGTTIAYVQSLAKLANSGSRSLIARTMIALDRYDKLSRAIDLKVLSEGANLTAILTTCLIAATRTSDPDVFAVIMTIETVKELYSQASLNISTETMPILFNPNRLHEAAADTRDSLLSAVIPNAESAQAYQIASLMAPTTRQPPPQPNFAQSPSYTSWPPQVPTLQAPQTTGQVAGTSIQGPAVSPSGAPPNAPPGAWCWDFQRPGGCKLPPGTCRMKHVVVPCPKLQTPGGCPLPPSACRYRH